MNKNLTQALENVELTYAQVIDIANDMLKELTEIPNNIISSMGEDINSLSVDQLKNYMWNLQHQAYKLCEVKEKSLLKAEISQTLRKEKYAMKFNEATGSAAVKENIALIESAEEQVVEALYNVVASSLKSKVDQLHRAVDCIKSILVTRMQEAKLSFNAVE